jgi:hypothetical protein
VFPDVAAPLSKLKGAIAAFSPPGHIPSWSYSSLALEETMKWIGAFAGLLMLSGPASAHSVAEFHRWSGDMQAGFIAGFYEGFVLSMFTMDDHPPRERIKECLNGRTNVADLVAAFKAWVAIHPEVMPQQLGPTYISYLFDICPSAKIKPKQ